MKPWHLRDPETFAHEKRDAETAYPHLHFLEETDGEKIVGSFPIADDRGDIDRFLVEIHLLSTYPDFAPVVFEVGGRIPRTLDRHCYELDADRFGNGSACVMLPEERWKVWPEGSSIRAFLDGPVRNYFISQAIFERDGVWPFGQWDHGFVGQKRYYAETFGTDDVAKVRKYLEYLIAKKMKGHWDCPCGSGLRVRNCHMPLLLRLRSDIPRKEAAKALYRLEDGLKRGLR